MSETILIVDDDRGIRYSLKRMFEEKGFKAVAARNGREALDLLDQGLVPDLTLIDIVMPGLSGLDLLEAIKQKNPKFLAIMVTAHGTTERAIRAMKLGAYDYIQKPFDLTKMWTTIQKALEVARSAKNPVSYPPFNDQNWAGESIIGDSPRMQDVYKTIGQIAERDVNVLLIGESGTGKELVARAIYHHGRRSNYPFIAINCAAIPENLLESELFGHERGAFTGAEYKRIGRFEQAHRGTIFLDEIGDMPIHIQAKILRVIQEGEIQRLGGSETIPVDVRLIAATNKPIEEGIREGWFRQDLYWRLNVVTIYLPPLRERKEDIHLLAQYFLSRFTKELQKDIVGIRPECMELLLAYHWPGNVRELENVLKRAIVICRGNEIMIEDLPDHIKAARENSFKLRAELAQSLDLLLDKVFDLITATVKEGPDSLDAISLLEKEMIERAIRKTSGNKVQAASLLGINRNTLRNKMERYGIADAVSEREETKRWENLKDEHLQN
ncbi:MAG: sigma-54 dependent transcriptional regulator [bacterium]|nr:sigma-54 dependent transcriptional regulator [bacterium]